MKSTIAAATTELDEVARRFEAAARSVFAASEPRVVFESPRRHGFGDFATNVAFTISKAARRPPQEVASAIVAAAREDAWLATIVVDAMPVAGFINIRLSPAYWQSRIADVLRAGNSYGRSPTNGRRISLEFGSANPTGPLVVVQGRTCSIGATLAEALRYAGYDVFTEWIINDAGSQIATLGRSVYARYRELREPAFPFPDDGYPGDYVREIAHALHERDGDRWQHVPEADAAPVLGRFARDVIVEGQKVTAARFGVHYDLWQSERELHEAGAIDAGIARLRELGLTYERDGALWVRTSATGDSEDRVAVRSDGRPTYYSNDIAYHYDKLRRADCIIDILGPDHHGYIARLQALAAAYDRPGDIEVLISQQITLRRGEEIISMSKRAGEIVTLDEIMDEVGVDAARFFFTMLSIDQPLTFDLQLAKSQSNENPVYYVQYSHARIASVLQRAATQLGEEIAERAAVASLEPLVHPAELALARRLAEFPVVIAGVAEARAPHRLARYARDVAADFHQFYDACRIITPDEPLSLARIALAIAAKTVLASVLRIIGVSAPDSM